MKICKKLGPKNIPPIYSPVTQRQCQKIQVSLFCILFYLTIKITLYSSSWHSKMFPCLQFQSFAKDPESWWQNKVIICCSVAKLDKLILQPTLSLDFSLSVVKYPETHLVTPTPHQRRNLVLEKYSPRINLINNMDDENDSAALYHKKKHLYSKFTEYYMLLSY